VVILTLKIKLVIIAIILCIIFKCTYNIFYKETNKIYIFAATSLGPVLQNIVNNIGHDFNIILNIASSSTISHQIKNGAVCDIVILANTQWMDYLSLHKKILVSSRLNFLSNSLVFIKNINALRLTSNILDFIDNNNLYISIANPNFVPAGKYVFCALKYFSLFNKYKKFLLLASNVRLALLWIEKYEAPIGVVYYTDINFSKYISIIANIPTFTHIDILYSLAKCTDNYNKFNFFYVYRFLYYFKNIGQRIFLKYNFKYLQ